MLVLSRKEGERVQIGEDCFVTVVRITGNRVTLGFDAPQATKIVREEVANRRSFGERIVSAVLGKGALVDE